MNPKGILVIRSDIAADVEADYLAWLSREHTLERVGIDGFVSARMFRCCRSDLRRYLIVYDLDSPAVVDSPAYLERLNNPTPWSARMMPQMGAFMRGGGAVVAGAGAGSGTALLPLMLGDADNDPGQAELDELAARDGIVAVRLVRADAARTTAPTSERKLRGGDGSFDRMLLIEALSVEAAITAAEAHPSLTGCMAGSNPADATYREIFHLGKVAPPA
jgi:hypothetical protein